MDKPRFTIITCTYNSERYIDTCIKSVKEQSFKNYEHLFVDAFSTDSTREKIENYQKEDDRVRLIQAEPKGISNAMNTGIENSGGEIIQFLHSDDQFDNPDTLTTVDREFLSDPKATMVIGLCSRLKNDVRESNLMSESTFKRRKLFLKYLIYLECYIAHPATFMKKEVFDRHGLFDENYKIAMDYEYWLRSLDSERYRLINKELTLFRHHEEAASFDREKAIKEEDIARAKYAGRFKARIARLIFRDAVKLKESLNRKREK